MSDAHDSCAVLETVREEKLKEPEDWRVIFLNDDFTAMEFVVAVIMTVFNHPRQEAERIMLDVHTKGRGIVGTYTRDIAETKAAQVHRAARENDYPLRCIVDRAP